MKKIFLIRLACILIVFGILSCNKNKTKNKEIHQNNDSIKNELEVWLNEDLKLNFTVGDEIVYDSSVVISRQETPYRGEVIQKNEWRDLGGLNRFILSSVFNYDKGFGRAEIFAYQYVKVSDEWSLVWRMNDFIDGMGCDLSINILDCKILDIDSNSVAETLMMYNLTNSCDAGGISAKLILAENGKKIVIRGMSHQYLIPTEEVFNKVMDIEEGVYIKFKNIDAGVFSEDTIFVKYASDFWDEIIENENAQYKKDMEAFRKRQEEEAK